MIEYPPPAPRHWRFTYTLSSQVPDCSSFLRHTQVRSRLTSESVPQSIPSSEPPARHQGKPRYRRMPPFLLRVSGVLGTRHFGSSPLLGLSKNPFGEWAVQGAPPFFGNGDVLSPI